MTTPDNATIAAVCAKLDPSDDAHWTSQGVPRMDVLAGMGLTIDRKALNEALPGFSRAKLLEAQQSDPPAPKAAAKAPEETTAQASHRHILARARRRQEALAYLASGKGSDGKPFTPADIGPVRSKLDQNIGARNRQGRRELSN